jgi:hypothetical protein
MSPLCSLFVPYVNPNLDDGRRSLEPLHPIYGMAGLSGTDRPSTSFALSLPGKAAAMARSSVASRACLRRLSGVFGAQPFHWRALPRTALAAVGAMI